MHRSTKLPIGADMHKREAPNTSVIITFGGGGVCRRRGARRVSISALLIVLVCVFGETERMRLVNFALPTDRCGQCGTLQPLRAPKRPNMTSLSAVGAHACMLYHVSEVPPARKI